MAKDTKKPAEQTSVEALRAQLAKLYAEKRVGKVKDVRSISKLRDQIARALTAERMQELGATA
jgi:ribosomal protein L29